MHLYALDKNENLIFVRQADKHSTYFCRECGSRVKCRGGFLRQMHFYHLESHRNCRQNSKSLIHLQVQAFLENVLPECELEKRFSAINRIADAVWESEKLIFEIQCSSITAREIEARNRDYRSQGYHVIWILHDRLYNKKQLTAAEHLLQESPHYFTNINAEGQGHIYDQWDLIVKGRRLKTARREVKISSTMIRSVRLLDSTGYPKRFLKRLRSSSIYFCGDFLDYFLSMEESERPRFLATVGHDKDLLNELEKVQHKGKLCRILRELMNLVAFPYRLALYLLVDKLTR